MFSKLPKSDRTELLKQALKNANKSASTRQVISKNFESCIDQDIAKAKYLVENINPASRDQFLRSMLKKIRAEELQKDAAEKTIPAKDKIYGLLHIALGLNIPIARELLEEVEEKDVNRYANTGRTFLHDAIEGGNLEYVKVLIGKKANPHLRQKGGTEDYNALGLAMIHNKYACLKALLEGADCLTTDQYGWTLLHHAASLGLTSVIPLLIGKGIPVNAQDKELRTPLYLAMRNQKLQTVTTLVDNGADPLLANIKNVTPFDLAKGIEKATNRNIILNKLFSSKTIQKDVNRKNKSGLTALDYASKLGITLWVEKFIRGGATVGQSDIAVDTGNRHSSAVLFTPSTSLFEMVKRKDYRSVEQAIANGANPFENSNGTVLIYRTIEDADFEMTSILLTSPLFKKDPNREDMYGYTALHYAALSGNKKCIENLISLGASVNKANKYGLTPLNLVNDTECRKALETADSTSSTQLLQ